MFEKGVKVRSCRVRSGQVRYNGRRSTLDEGEGSRKRKRMGREEDQTGIGGRMGRCAGGVGSRWVARVVVVFVLVGVGVGAEYTTSSSPPLSSSTLAR